jgi:protein-disulfide isomerase
MKNSEIRAGSVFIALVVLAASPGCRRDTSLVADHVYAVKGYDVAHLNEFQRQEFMKVVNSELCPCPRVLAHLGACIDKGRACPEAHLAARYAIRRIAAGDSMSRVILMLDRMFQQGVTAKAMPNDDDAPSLGPANAKVTLTVFSDFECPFCKRTAPVFEKLKKAFEGKLRVVFRNLPLVKIHRHAMNAALAAVAAHKQGKFWEMHDMLFKNDLNLEKENLVEYARRVKLDAERFKRDLEAPETRKRVEADMALAKKIGVAGTPALFVNGKPMTGGHRFETVRDYIEVALDSLPAGAAPVAASGAAPGSR